MELININDINIDKPSFQFLLNFYSLCSLESRILPLYFSKSFKSQNKNNIEIAENTLIKLLHHYEELKNKKNNFSLISTRTNEFIEAFEEMISKFKSAGINFDELNLEKVEKEYEKNIQFIELPKEKKLPNFLGKVWTIKKQDNEQHFIKENKEILKFGFINEIYSECHKSEYKKEFDIEMKTISLGDTKIGRNPYITNDLKENKEANLMNDEESILKGGIVLSFNKDIKDNLNKTKLNKKKKVFDYYSSEDGNAKIEEFV